MNLQSMSAMVLQEIGQPLVAQDRPVPEPLADQVRIRVDACAVCRTDLHVLAGELPLPDLPLIPGHEIVGRIEALGSAVTHLSIGQRVGVPWLGDTCGQCPYCHSNHENLCDKPVFTGYTCDGGFASHALAKASYCFSLEDLALDSVSAAPLLCAGLIGWRSLMMAADAPRLGLYGFGAAAHLIAQVATTRGQQVFAFTRPGDLPAQEHARQLGALWVGDSDSLPPQTLDAAIIFAPVGPLIPAALRSIRKGGRVVCAGIHMSDIPSFAYELLWGERQVISVANLTRSDGDQFLKFARSNPLRVDTITYPLKRANDALSDLQAGRVKGAAVLIP